MAELRITDLTVRHVGPIQLAVQADQIICISGGSGTGKSLLLRAIVDIIPHQGQLQFDQVSMQSTPPPTWRRLIGLLPAESQWWCDSVGEHFQTRPDELRASLGFPPEVWGWEVARCSTGEKQRLALLRLLANQPKCLLLDEPTGSLDPDNTLRVENVIQQYQTMHAAPVIWVSHSYEQIERVATQHYVLSNGSLELKNA